MGAASPIAKHEEEDWSNEDSFDSEQDCANGNEAVKGQALPGPGQSESMSTGTGPSSAASESNEKSDVLTSYKTCVEEQVGTDQAKAKLASVPGEQPNSIYESAVEGNQSSTLSSSNESNYKSPKSPGSESATSDGKPRPCHAGWDCCISPLQMMKVTDSMKLLAPAHKRALNKPSVDKLANMPKVKVQVKARSAQKLQPNCIPSEQLSPLAPKQNHSSMQAKSSKTTKTASFTASNFCSVFKTSNREHDLQGLSKQDKPVITNIALKGKTNDCGTNLKTGSVDSLKGHNIKMPQVYKDQNKKRH